MNPNYGQMLVDCHFYKIIVEGVIDLPYTKFIDLDPPYLQEFHDRMLEQIPDNPSLRKALMYSFMVSHYGMLFDLQRAVLMQNVKRERGVMGNPKVRLSIYLIIAVFVGFSLGLMYPDPINMLLATVINLMTLGFCITTGFSYLVDPDKLDIETLTKINFIATCVKNDQDIRNVLFDRNGIYKNEVEYIHERLIVLLNGKDII